MTVAQLIDKLNGLMELYALHDLPVVVRDGRGQWRDAEAVAYNSDRVYIEEAITWPEETAPFVGVVLK